MASTQPEKSSRVKLILQRHSDVLYSSHPCLFRPWYLPCSPLPLGLCTCSPSTRKALPSPSLSGASSSSHDSDLSARCSSLGKLLLTFLTRCFFPIGSQSTRLLSSVTLISDKQICIYSCDNKGFPGGSDSKESACHAGDLSLIPGSGRSPGERNGNPFQYSCLENPMD